MAGAAPAAGAVGARAVFAGVDQFLGQLRALGTELTAFGTRATGSIEGLNDDLAGVSAGFTRFNAAIATTGLAVGAVTGTFSTLTAPVRAVGSAVINTAGEVVEGSSKIVGALGDIAKAGVDLSEKGALGVAGLGTALVGLGVTAVTESAKYERGLKDIQAVTKITTDELGTLDESIRRVAARFPSSIGDIQAAARELGKAGVDVRDLTSEIIQLALAAQNLSSGELTAEGAAEAVGSNMALFRASFERTGDTVEQQARRIISAVTGVANETRASIPEVVSAINKLGPNLAPLGGTVEQTAALAGIVLKQGPRGQEAGTALANLFQRLENPSREAAQILKERPQLNLFDVEGKARPAIDVIKAFADTYGAAGRAASGMSEATATAELAEIAQTRTLRALNLVLDAGVKSYSDFLEKISETDVLAQAATQNQSLIRQLEILRNNAQLAGIAFGEDFVRGLGGAVAGINTLLQDQDKATQFGRLVGRGASSLITGAPIDELRAGVNDAPFFGPDVLPTFDAIFGAGEKIRGNILDLIRDAANLGKTLGLITFPEGLPGAINATGTALSTILRVVDDVVKAFDAAAPEVIRRLQEITGATTFEELITNAQAFGKEIQTIFTENGGDESFKNLKDEATNFFKVVREEGKPTLESMARLARTIEDVAPTFLRAGETAIRVLANITRAASSLLELLLKITAFDMGVTGNIFDSLGRALSTGFPSAGRGLTGNFTIVTPAMIADQTRQRNDTLSSQQEEERTQVERQRTSSTQAGARLPSPGLSAATTAVTAEALANLAAQQQEVADTADAANTAAGGLSDTIGGTEGAYHNDGEAKREAAAATKALEQAEKSLSSQMRTLDKDITDAGGSFDKTISGAQQRWLDGLDQIAESTSDAVGRIRRTAAEARSKALEGFNLQVERGGGFFASLDEEGNLQIDMENLIEGTNTIFRHGQEDRKREVSQGIEDRQRLRQLEDENETTRVSRHNEDITRSEQQRQEQITRERQQGIEDRERLRQREQDRELTLFGRSQEQSLTQFTAGQTAANTARLRAREDQRASEALARDMAKASTPEERTKLLTAFTESRKTTSQQRADQDADTKFAQQQQLALTKFRQDQEDALTKHRQDLEDKNIAHRRELEIADIAFRIQQETDMVGFRRNLENIETSRRRAASKLEIAERRKDELEVLGFDRTQQQEAQLFSLTNERIPDLQRQLAQVNQQENDQITNTFETATRQLLRAGLTLRREVQAAGVTETEQLRRLQERFNNESRNTLERLPESKRAAFQQSIDSQNAVFAARIAIAQGRQGTRGSQVTSEADAVTQQLLDQIRSGGVDTSSIEAIFGQQATANLVTTSLLATPQVDRLTRALEGLTTKIDKIGPGVHIDTVEQTIQQPTTPQGAIIGSGTIGPVGGIV